jgi:peptidoglycan-associated lipoprotein
MVRSVMAVLALAIFPGLTAAQEPVLQASQRATLEEVVRFDFDEATITAETEEFLRAKLPILRSSAAFLLLLEGHADERGSVEYNLALGGRRAESVRDFLIGLGISADRLTTTSFGEERPLLNRSDAEAWAQNRRVEFVISGVAGPLVAEGDVPGAAEDTVGIDLQNPDLTQPAVVGDVTVVPPPTVEPVPRPVRTRENSERDRRSRFYRDPSSSSTVLAAAVDYPWVSRNSTWSAEWLGPMLVEEVEFDGKIESFVQEGDARTAFPYTWVRLDLEPGFRPSLGDALQIFRPARVNRELGVILRPMGVMSVTRVAPNVVEGLVLEAYGLVKVGDLVRPAPVFDLRPGEYPAMVTNRTEATVVEFGEVHQLYGLRQVTILDKGSLDGLDIGDEYVAFYGDGSTEQVIGRLRVVLTEEETSSAEIVTVEGAVFQEGTAVYLDRKMR